MRIRDSRNMLSQHILAPQPRPGRAAVLEGRFSNPALSLLSPILLLRCDGELSMHQARGSFAGTALTGAHDLNALQ